MGKGTKRPFYKVKPLRRTQSGNRTHEQTAAGTVEVYAHFYLYWLCEGRGPHMPTVFCGWWLRNEDLQLLNERASPSADHVYATQTPGTCGRCSNPDDGISDLTCFCPWRPRRTDLGSPASSGGSSHQSESIGAGSNGSMARQTTAEVSCTTEHIKESSILFPFINSHPREPHKTFFKIVLAY